MMKKEYTQTSSSASSVQSQGKKTVLSDRFLIGEELGRGAYGQVYKGMDTTTGDVVAIKQISLSGVSQENLAGVMGEIDLLKTLNHKNIVKYIGSFKTRSHLYIILEFMENGALSSVIKPNRFGVFPETLVAIYIAQVLQGLAYLHDQGVVHRDIKGANILTTKDGLVKLADFGVAAKLGELEEQHNDELHQNVVGTPYWMAPEVIEMTQVTPASDIWSVGCLIIELLTGYPPYYDLQPMSALFRIVQDAHPPLPESVSPLLENFLLKCFQKDPSARPDARSLLQHEWVQFNRKTLRGTWSRSGGFKNKGKASDAHETVNSVVARILQAEFSEDELSTRGSVDTAAVAGLGSAQHAAAAVRTIDAAAGPLASNTPARLALQQDALLTASSTAGTATPTAAGMNMQHAQPVPLQVTGAADGLPPVYPQQRKGGSVELAAVSNGSPSPCQSPRSRFAQAQQLYQQPQQQPSQQALQQQQSLQQHSAAGQVAGQRSHQQQQQLHLQMQQQQQQQQQQYSSSELSTSADRSADRRPPPLSFVGQQLRYGPAVQPGPDTPQSAAAGANSRLSPAGLAFPLPGDIESPLSNLLARMQNDQTAAVSPGQIGASGALLAWLQDETISPAGNKGAMGDGLFGGSFLLPSLSSNSIESMQSSQVDLKSMAEGSFLMESKRKVRHLVRSLRPAVKEANMTPQQAAASLAAMFTRVPESKQQFLQESGVLAALELLESEQVRLAEAALDLLTAFAAGQARLLESLCLTGFVPIIARMAAGQYGAVGLSTAGMVPAAAAAGKTGSRDTGSPASGTAAGGPYTNVPAGSGIEVMRLRCKAAGFVAQLCLAKETTLQMFIACGGVWSLVMMVQDNLLEPTTLTPLAVGCIWKVLDTYGALPVSYICRILAHAGLVQRLYAVVKQLASIDRQQQQQRGIGSGGVARMPAAGGLKLHHLHSPSSPSVFGQVFVPGLGIEAPDAAAVSPDAPPQASTADASKKANMSKEVGLAGMDELQHRRALSLGDSAAAAALAAAATGDQDKNPTQGERLMETSLDLLLVLAHGDTVVKNVMCSRDNLQHLLDLLQRLQDPEHLLKVMKTLSHLTSDPTVLAAVKDSGAISQLVPFLTRQSEAVLGQSVVLEALGALYNICKFNKKVHLEVAATAGIIPHLCRFATETLSMSQTPTAGPRGNSSSNPVSPSIGDPLADPAVLSAQAAAEARRIAVRTLVLPMLIGMVHTSSSTRAKLWASNGLDLFLQLMATEDPQMQVSLMRTLDLWLAEDHTRVENRLCQREAVSQLVEVYSRLCRSAGSARSPVMPQMLDSLKLMLGRSSKVAVALAAGGLVPPLLEPLTAGLVGSPGAPAGSNAAPILRAKLLEIVRILYQHYPRPKEFIMKYRIQDVLLRLLESEGRGEDAVKIEAQKLLNAFHINVLL